MAGVGAPARPRRRASGSWNWCTPPRHVRELRELCEAGGGEIDADTFVGETSDRAALHAAGGACAMTRALLAGEASVGFCGVRPSGHHAERGAGDELLPIRQRRGRGGAGDQGAGGACWSSLWTGTCTTATAPRRSSAAAEDVLFVSIHQSGLFPGTGALPGRRARGAGEGYTINLPVPGGFGGGAVAVAAGARGAAGGGCVRAADLVLLSAGFDAHAGRTRWRACRLQTGSFAADGLPRARAGGSPRGAAGGRAGGRLRTRVQWRSACRRRWRRWGVRGRQPLWLPRRC